MKSICLSSAFCLVSMLALTVRAAFIPSASSGPSGDPQGEVTRGKIAQAISAADDLLAVLGSTDVEGWADPWLPFYGTAAAAEAKSVTTEIRAALASLRDGWDKLSVQTITLKKGWNSFYLYVHDPAPAAAVIRPSDYSSRLRSRVAAEFANPSQEQASLCLDGIAQLASSYVEIRQSLIKAFTDGTSSSGFVADWPVDDVYVYMGSTDAAAQFSTDSSSEAKASNPYLTWSAAAPDSVNLGVLPAGRVATAFSTASGSRTVVLLGTSVRAGSMSWHKTGGSDNPAEWNYLGLSLWTGRLQAEKLMKNLDFTYSSLAKLSGTDPACPSFTVAAPGAPLTVTDGETLIADATATSSWYPAPTALPSDGITIAAGAVETTFKLRNDTAAAQVVTGLLYRTGNLASALKAVTGVQIMRTEATGWQQWCFDQQANECEEFAKTNKVFVDSLAAGETRSYRVRFPRTVWDVLAREAAYSGEFRRTFSGVMRFNFAGSSACSYLSLSAASDNNAVVTPWPAGLWIGTLAFDKVSHVKGNQTIIHDVPAKGTMYVRGILHVGAEDGALKYRLLHHVIVESMTSSNAVDGTFVETRIYAKNAKPDANTAATITRLDSIAMDIDNPMVEGTGSFTNGLSFAWTVSPDGRANPFHHPYHPEHDGLQWDFETPAPSGDDMNNYRQGQVKPETWSIQNWVSLTADPIDMDEIPETVSGACTWTIGNVRRTVNGENIRASGRFTLQRIKSVGKLIWE